MTEKTVRQSSPLGLLQAFLEHFAKLEEAKAKEVSDLTMKWAEIVEDEENDLDALFSVTESPMERAFLLGAMMNGSGLRIESAFAGACFVVHAVSGDCLRLYAQQEFVDIRDEVIARADFAIRIPATSLSVVVEIDGHEFHEKTKEQAQRDKERDRKLVARGQYVIRFTGSEVYADPCKCWVEVWELCGALRASYVAWERQVKEGIRTEVLEELTAPAKRLPAAREVAAE